MHNYGIGFGFGTQSSLWFFSRAIRLKPVLRTFLPFALLLAGLAILGRDVLFRGRVISGPDLVNYFLPTTLLAREWLRQGVLPLWNPMTFCGWPLVGDPQLRWFYPPNLLLLAADPVRVFSLLMIGYVGFGAAGMWFYLRKAAGVGPWPALCGAATVGLAGFFPCHLMSGIAVFPATGAWVPWILLLGWRVGQIGASPVTVGLFAAAIGAQVLSGAPQIAFYTWIALILQAFWCASGAGVQVYRCGCGLAAALRSAPGILFRYAVGGALGIALGASSLIPTSEFGALSLQRSGKARWESVTECSLAPRFLWLAVAPKFFGDPHIEGTYWGGQEGYWDICGYVGIGPLIALLVAFSSWRSLFGKRDGTAIPPVKASTAILPVNQPDHDTHAITVGAPIAQSSFAAFHLTLGGLALFLAFGGYNPLFYWLYRWVPGFDRFRVPSRWLLFCQFSLATLLALVLERLLDEARECSVLKKPSAVAVGCLFVVLVMVASLTPKIMQAAGIANFFPNFDPGSGRLLDIQLRNWTAGSLWRAAGFSLGWIILLIAASRKIHALIRRALPLLAALLVLADVLTFAISMPATRTPQGQAEEFYPKSPLIEFLAAGLAGHRFLAADDVHAWWNDQNQPELWANRATIAGLRDARGYYPVCLRWFGHFINALSGRPAQFYMGGLLSVGKTLNPSLLSMLDVKFLLSYENLAVQGLHLTQLTSFGLKVYEVVGRRGSAFVAREHPTVGLSDDEEIQLLTNLNFRSQEYALASELPPEGLTTDEGSPRAVDFARRTPNRIELHVGRGQGNLIVVSEAYHPGWKALVDGQPSKVVRANHALIGVYVPSGKHEVALAFQPDSFRTGLYLTLSALLILVALRAVAFSRRPNATRPGRPTHAIQERPIENHD